ncbi:ABC-2 type transport system ATP-binding protein [Pedobacter steynii]|uniref:ABC-2 type transport system ATP-binding protein n=1 Tax=Pedobacter steynii TaxID=430522 RepID=A0A1G9NQJ9_9SPHI|nr:ATP-binding cassette domain-containing protein [Pedobacter steynii]NQX39224.1 ATP-binding cassette domain-containing protein [Pedobacter steynii]SDL88631.1 ABC-2 type transport system ATP-binding protein [Pedobacter steynii]
MLQAISLSKHYQSHVALDNLNLEVKAGEIFCLLGQNGAGKTTTINLFLGFTAASSGKALINNKEVRSGSAETRKHIAYIPEVVMLYGQLTALENLDYFSMLAGFSYDKESLSSFLSQCGLQESAHYKPLSGFSKGMRQKVGIAIALAKNAAVILMDEPTSGLDPKATDEFTELVKALGLQGKSILMATHDIFNAVNIGTHIGIMRQGKLIHTLKATDINANDLQKLYLETI